MQLGDLWGRLVQRVFSGAIQRQVRAALAVSETDATLMSGQPAGRDRYAPDRADVLEQALEAWRTNPLARRLVGLTSQYVVGGGISITCRHEPTQRFIHEFWQHRLNRMAVRLYEWCDELTRTGNLFVLVSTDGGGMSYVRAVPASEIERIEARANDVEQPLRFYPRQWTGADLPECWSAYAEDEDAPAAADGRFAPVMLHFTVNRPVGGQWGESDLAPLLRWLGRYASWLEDRARLNRYRNSFMFVVKSHFTNEAERAARQSMLTLNPPSPGSILVSDESESWEVLSPKLESGDANTDGLALKKMIASGAGVPLHFLAEPESATRTTAEAAGGPTYRHFEQRQKYFLWLVADVLRVVVNRRALVDRRISRRAEVLAGGADISARDNLGLAMAGTNAMSVLGELRDRKLIDDVELLRLSYRFMGEGVDLGEMLRRGQAAPPSPVTARPPGGVGKPAETRPEQQLE